MNRAPLGACLALAVLAASTGLAWADDTPASGPPPDKSAFNLFNPAPDADLRSLCTDRPTKSSGPCTVDAGHFQIESDLINVTFQRKGGVTTDTYLFTDPTLKVGLTNALDGEVSIAPVQTIVTHDHGADATLTGIGDLFGRLKWNIVGVDGGDLSISLSPYIKLPTARHGIGNGTVEEGLLIPAQVTLPAGWSLIVNGELDALKNQNDTGRHINYVGILCLNHPLSKTLTGSVELWTDVNDDPNGVVRQSSFDLAAAWIPAATPNIQFDAGVNIGLNNATPGAQVYLGASRRF
jgi:hypothetical protein